MKLRSTQQVFLLQNSDKYSYRLITKRRKGGYRNADTDAGDTDTNIGSCTGVRRTTGIAAGTDSSCTGRFQKEVSLDDLYHLKGVSILYTSYRLADKYGSSQIRAEQGKKLLVAEFSLKNNSGAKKRLN